MKNEYMTFDDVLKTIHLLAHSQGYYGRLLNAIYSLPEDEFFNFKKEMEDQKFKNSVDMILYFES